MRMFHVAFNGTIVLLPIRLKQSTLLDATWANVQLHFEKKLWRSATVPSSTVLNKQASWQWQDQIFLTTLKGRRIVTKPQPNCIGTNSLFQNFKTEILDATEIWTKPQQRKDVISNATCQKSWSDTKPQTNISSWEGKAWLCPCSQRMMWRVWETSNCQTHSAKHTVAAEEYLDIPPETSRGHNHPGFPSLALLDLLFTQLNQEDVKSLSKAIRVGKLPQLRWLCLSNK